MAQRVEIPGGVINGVNAVFTTSTPYRPQSLSVWINGQQIVPSMITETDPPGGIFTINDASCIPRSRAGCPSDVLAIDFDDPSTEAEIVIVDEVCVFVADTGETVEATVCDLEAITVGVNDAPVEISTQVCDLELVMAQVNDIPVGVFALVEDC